MSKGNIMMAFIAKSISWELSWTNNILITAQIVGAFKLKNYFAYQLSNALENSALLFDHVKAFMAQTTATLKKVKYSKRTLSRLVGASSRQDNESQRMKISTAIRFWSYEEKNSEQWWVYLKRYSSEFNISTVNSAIISKYFCKFKFWRYYRHFAF